MRYLIIPAVTTLLVLVIVFLVQTQWGPTPW
ncbi:hypothetical protein SAMN02744778_01637 [Pantoea sp. GL120224-02]|jgi:hypothetical protein|nr:hypothetical protein SAMN02744778_01637 [Pantoea sp. GL120224-02]